jgi:hypothetical protein
VIRLRPPWSDADLKRIYARPHDHLKWRDHHLRIGVTKAIAIWMADQGLGSAADLSCGNGAVLNAVNATTKFYGDYAPGHRYTGPIEHTVEQIPHVDLFVCCETLEHLDRPLEALCKIREKSSMILLSTPVDNWDDTNEEHYWAWSKSDVDGLLTTAGFRHWLYTEVDPRPGEGPYKYGIWGWR